MSRLNLSALLAGNLVTFLVTLVLAVATVIDMGTQGDPVVWGVLSGALYGQIAGMLVSAGVGAKQFGASLRRDFLFIAAMALTGIVSAFVALLLVLVVYGISPVLSLAGVVPSAVVVGVLASGILVLRWWSLVRKSRLIWNLANVFLITIVVLAIILAGVLSFPAIVAQTDTGESMTTLVMTRYVPTFIALLVFSFGTFAFTLPPLVGLGYFAIRSATRRVRDLTNTTNRFREGDLAARVTVEGADEIAQLQTNYNAMADQLQETLEQLSLENDRVSALLKQRRELFAAVSHELRTPVATIRLSLESLQRQMEAATTRSEIEMALRQIDLLTRLIDDIFALARIEVAALTVRAEPINVPVVVQRSVEAMESLAWTSRKVTIVQEVDPGAVIEGDPDRLDQAIRNLISNAIRHSLPGGIIHVEGRLDDQHVTISVEDYGIGIPVEDRDRIWEPFVTGSDSTERTGLGLSLVRGLTEAMGGRVTVESEPDEGAVFRLIFPRLDLRQIRDISATAPQQAQDGPVTSAP